MGDNSGRSGAAWTEEEYVELTDRLRNGEVLDDIAAAHGRTVNALHKVMSRMLPEEKRAPAGQVEPTLRERLASGYAWQPVLARRMAAEDQRYWSEADDRAALQGWRDRHALDELAGRIGVEELALVTRLIRLGAASGPLEVTDRLGCSPDGVVALRRNLAQSEAAATVVVLTDHHGADLVHISVHPSTEAAEQALATFPQHPQPEGDVELVWTIASRTPGAGDQGPASTGTIRPLRD